MKDIYIQAIGLVAGILTASSILPQLVKTIRSKQAEDISSFVFVILIAGTGMWALYGLLLDDFPIMITNGFSFKLNVAMTNLK